MFKREIEVLVVDIEGAPRDAIGIAAGDVPEIWMPGHVVIEIIEAESDVLQVAVPVWDLNRGNDATVVRHLDFHAVGIGQRVERDRFAIDLSPRFAGNATSGDRGGILERLGLQDREEGECGYQGDSQND